MTNNYFSILFFFGKGIENSLLEHYTSCDDLFGITNCYGLIQVEDTPSLKIINGFLSNEDARRIYDFDE